MTLAEQMTAKQLRELKGKRVLVKQPNGFTLRGEVLKVVMKKRQTFERLADIYIKDDANSPLSGESVYVASNTDLNVD